MLVVNYCEEGKPCNDFHYKDEVDAFLACSCPYLKTSSELVFNELTLRTMKGEIPVESIKFIYKGCPCKLDMVKGLIFERTPNGFPEPTFGSLTNEIIKVGFGNIKNGG